MTHIDPRAVVDPSAVLAEGVTVAPFAVIGPNVTIGAGTWVGPHVVFDNHVTVGANNKFYPHCSIGFPPQDLKYKGEETRLVIGDGNVFREGSTVHRGTLGGGGITRIGNHGYFMVNAHIAHDCILGDGVLFANAGTLAGHVEIGDRAVIGAYSGVHQFCRVGKAAYVGGYSKITQDCLPFCTTAGNRAHCYGINRIGLKRSGMERRHIDALDHAVRTLFRSSLKRADALAEIEAMWGDVEEVRVVLDFVRASRRGIVPIRLGQVEADAE
ncbi:MAG: acyl-ACP--UDP-N-acetylglucosamine O-acyltransferase [Acidobacteriota bacterium]